MEKPIQKKTVRAVKKIKGESRRMNRDWVMRPFSNMTNVEPRRAVAGRSWSARRVR